MCDDDLTNIRIMQYNLGKGKRHGTFLLDPKTWEYDILAIQEPAVIRKNEAFSSYNTARGHFHLEFQDSPATRVAFHINKRIPVESWEVIFITTDLSLLKLNTTSGGLPVVLNIFNVYNPSPASTGSTAGVSTLPKLDEALEAIAEEGQDQYTMVLGDFNLHHPMWGGQHVLGTHAQSANLIDLAERHCLELANHEGTITRRVKDVATAIDLTWASSDLLDIITSWGVDLDADHCSDHLPIGMNVDLSVEHTPLAPARNWKLLDKDRFLSELASNYPKPHVLDTKPQCDDYAAEIHACLTTAIDVAVPFRKSTTTAKARSWWNRECKEVVDNERNDRHRLFRNASNPPGDWHTHQQLVNLRNKTIKKAKSKTWREFLHKASKVKGTPVLWKMTKWAKNESDKPRETPRFPTISKGQGDERVSETTWEGKAALLKEKFYPVPPPADLEDIQNTVPHREQVQSPRFFRQLEVVEAIMKPANTSPGHTGISSSALKASLPMLREVYTHLFNACARLSHHPLPFKQAETVALRKPNKVAGDVGSYRPIALLDTLGKAMERLMGKRVIMLAEQYKMLPKAQMGGRKHRDTTSALELITEQIHTVWSKGGDWIASVLSLDMTGAYDHADHIRLINILRQRGLPEWIVLWVESFLSDRTSTLRIGPYKTEVFKVTNGIPQGSPVSPILFLFYNAELIEALNGTDKNASAGGFVDDVNIIVYGRSIQENLRTLSHMHDIAMNWARRHGALFNPAKYELLHCSRSIRKHDLTTPIQLGGLAVDAKPAIRILGVQLDSKLQWHPHVRKIESKMSSTLRALQCLSASTWGPTFGKARHIYQAVVVPAITFGSTVWHTPEGVHGSRKWVSRACQKIQNIGLRSVSGCFKATPALVMEKECHIPPMELKLTALRGAYCARRDAARLNWIIQEARNKIASRINIKRSRTGKLPETPGQATDAWYRTRYECGRRLVEHRDLGFVNPSFPRTERDEVNFITAKNISIASGSLAASDWDQLWTAYKAKNPRFAHTVSGRSSVEWKPMALDRHIGLQKQQSTLAIQMRTEINGFRAYLHRRRVPGIGTPFCEHCVTHEGRERRETAKHVVQHCPRVSDEERDQLWTAAGTRSWSEMLTTNDGLDAVTRWLLARRELGQFSLAADFMEEPSVQQRDPEEEGWDYREGKETTPEEEDPGAIG